ncbi:MAG: hypothetical protein Q9174_000845 [Haloplaca sp. 1 TL-2023]
MPKKSIIDFFRPFGPPRLGKRPSSNAPSDDPRPSQRSRSTTPKAETAPVEKNEEIQRALPLTSSQSSSLTPISSPTRSPSSSERFSNDTPGASFLPLNNAVPDQSNASNTLDLQSIVGSSSQRIVRNGEVIIKDSDEERSDSEISLEDLEDLIAPRRPALSSPPTNKQGQTSLPSPPTTRSTGLKGRRGQESSASTFTAGSPPTNVPTYKFSLAALVKQRDRDEASRISIENSQLVLDTLSEQETTKTVPKLPALDEDLLAKIIKPCNDEDAPNMEKLLAAMQRTEALHEEMKWSFFRPEPISNTEPAECPSVKDPFWEQIFSDRITCQQAFLSDVLQAISTSVVHDCIVVTQIEGILDSIIDSLDNEDDGVLSAALSTIYSSVEDSSLKLQLLRHLPSLSAKHNLFRRRLAMAFFFCDLALLTRSSEVLVDHPAIIRHLNKKRFAVNNKTNYADLAALVAILSIGLDNAGPPPTDASKEVHDSFNERVDVLVEKIKAMSNQVIDTGASHRKRTEAKEVLESLLACLRFSVRTDQKPKGMLWGDDAGTEKQQSMMKHFCQTMLPRSIDRGFLLYKKQDNVPQTTQGGIEEVV